MARIELDRLAALRGYQAGGMTQIELARQLHLSERQVRRLLRRLEADGEAGLTSSRRGRPSNRRLSRELVATALELIRRRYSDFGPTFANEKLRELHGIVISTESLRQAMIAANLWKPKRRPQRRLHPPRERRPSRGELIQLDGSLHRWFETRNGPCVLHTAVDDASSELLGAHFAPTECGEGYRTMLTTIIERDGRPLAVYTDRHGIFSVNKGQTSNITQFARALEELDIELICATSPQAKGRVERAHQTLQKRLVRELRLRNISTIEAANAYLPEFLADYNRRFAVAPSCPLDAFRDAHTFNLEQIFATKLVRSLSKNLTFQVGRELFQIVDVKLAARLRGTKVDIRLIGENMFVWRRDELLRWQRLTIAPKQATPIDAKELNAHADRRRHHPEKAHTPAPNHPWKTLRRPATPT